MSIQAETCPYFKYPITTATPPKYLHKYTTDTIKSDKLCHFHFYGNYMKLSFPNKTTSVAWKRLINVLTLEKQVAGIGQMCHHPLSSGKFPLCGVFLVAYFKGHFHILKDHLKLTASNVCVMQKYNFKIWILSHPGRRIQVATLEHQSNHIVYLEGTIFSHAHRILSFCLFLW